MSCPVCFDILGSRSSVVTLPCQHPLCLACLLALQQPACPLCRGDIPEAAAALASSSDDDDDEPAEQVALSRAQDIIARLRIPYDVDLYPSQVMHGTQFAQVMLQLKAFVWLFLPRDRTTAFVTWQSALMSTASDQSKARFSSSIWEALC